ncbi:hypothetical protein Lal_00039374 [Lupinus albus]|nr:hypothetical protein Lal_00039374 [Lupinus albus]
MCPIYVKRWDWKSIDNNNGSILRKTYFANPPPGLDCAYCTVFVHHYNLTNTRSRKNLKVSHVGGSMGNARKISDKS